MEKDAFYARAREIFLSIATQSREIYDLMRAAGPANANAHTAARLARDAFPTFKDAQVAILELRLELERQHRAARSAKDKEPRPWTYRLDVVSDLQNTMLWALVGDDSALTNLSASLDADFGYLADRNIDSVAAAVREMNNDPRTFALIADLATGVAISDILQFTVSDEPRLSLALIEVKEGAVNQAILDLHDLFGRDKEQFEAAVGAFARQHGEAGMKQLARFVRQLERADTYHQLVSTGSAPDFVEAGQRHIQVVPPEQTYAPILNTILEDFYEHDRRYAFFPVDHLYFGFFKGDGSAPVRWQLDFQHHIYHDVKGAPWETCCFGESPQKVAPEVEFATYAKITFEDLRFSTRKAFLRPLVLSGLAPKFAADIYSENLYLWVYPVPDAIPQVLREAGLDVRLTRRGHGTAVDRSMFQIDGKYIDIHLNDEHEAVMRLGARPVMRTIFSLQTLASLIEQTSASVRSPMFPDGRGGDR